MYQCMVATIVEEHACIYASSCRIYFVQSGSGTFQWIFFFVSPLNWALAPACIYMHTYAWFENSDGQIRCTCSSRGLINDECCLTCSVIWGALAGVCSECVVCRMPMPMHHTKTTSSNQNKGCWRWRLSLSIHI